MNGEDSISAAETHRRAAAERERQKQQKQQPQQQQAEEELLLFIACQSERPCVSRGALGLWFLLVWGHSVQ